MKTPHERGAFGTWLRDERTGRGLSVEQVLADLRRVRQYQVARSVYAAIESGTRKPTAEQRRQLTGYFGTEPPEATTVGDSAILAALQEQTALLAQVWKTMAELVVEMRADRQDVREGFGALVDIIAEARLGAGTEAGAGSRGRGEAQGAGKKAP